MFETGTRDTNLPGQQKLADDDTKYETVNTILQKYAEQEDRNTQQTPLCVVQLIHLKLDKMRVSWMDNCDRGAAMP